MKMIAWHHKGKWLAEPLVNVLVKHKLYTKISYDFPACFILCDKTDIRLLNLT